MFSCHVEYVHDHGHLLLEGASRRILWQLQGLVRKQQGLDLLRCLFLRGIWDPIRSSLASSSRRSSLTLSSRQQECARIIVRGNNGAKAKKLTLSGPAHKLENALQLVNRYGREEVRPPPQAGDSPHQEVRTKPEGRKDAGEHSLRKHGTPAGKGGAGSQWAYARLRPAEVAVGPTRPGFPPKSLE